VSKSSAEVESTGFVEKHPYLTRLLLVVFFFTTISLLLYAGFNTSISMSEARATVEKLRPFFESIIKPGDIEATAWNTFMHNAAMTVIANTPLLGFPLMLYSAYQTGLTAKMLVMVSGKHFTFYQLYLKPHTLLEILAYSLAAAESAYLTPVMLRRSKEAPPLAPTLAVVIMELSLLWMASIVEAQLIISGA